MCKGSHHQPTTMTTVNHFSTSPSSTVDCGTSASCELCGAEAAVYCRADDAYLCRKCDGWVHKANFLASRHVRCVLCGTCGRFTRRFLIGAAAAEVGIRRVVTWTRGNQCSSSLANGRSQCKRAFKTPFHFF